MGADTDKPKTIDYTLIAQAATLPGDPWLCADSVAVLLGMFTSDGRPSDSSRAIPDPARTVDDSPQGLRQSRPLLCA